MKRLFTHILGHSDKKRKKEFKDQMKNQVALLKTSKNKHTADSGPYEPPLAIPMSNLKQETLLNLTFSVCAKKYRKK